MNETIESVLDDALHIARDRQNQYGDFTDNFIKASNIISSITGKIHKPDDVLLSVISLKLARLDEQGKKKKDTYIDIINYIAMFYILNQ